MAKKLVGEDGKVYVEKKKGGCLKFIGTLVLVFIAINFLLSFIKPQGDSNTQIKSENKTEQVKNVEPEITVTATEVIETFEQNELKGKETYTGKLAEISGTVDSVGESFGQTYITLGNDNDEFSIISLQCMFSKDNQQGLSDLNKGDKVTVLGTIGEQSINIEVKDCELKQ